MNSNPRRVDPKPGQESVWDYPRPPRLESTDKRIRVVLDGITLVDTTGAFRLLETSHPPVYYFPPADVQLEYLREESNGTYCEFKGRAYYYAAIMPDRIVPTVAWYYPHPGFRYQEIAGYIAFYLSKVDAGYVGETQATAQEGDFYGGWITPEIVGPFKGGAGTWGW
jgi:uncharacterized protein (DUF427 family)